MPICITVELSYVPPVKRTLIALTCSAVLSIVVAAVQPADALPTGQPHLPDLVTMAPSGFRLNQVKYGTGPRRLYFANVVANLGDGPLELRAVNNSTTGLTDAYQQIYTHNVKASMVLVSESVIGTFAFHPAHNHWHFGDFARYELRAIEPDGATGAVLRVTDKVSFCIIDTNVINSTLPHFGMGFSHSCGQSARQGLRVGHGDTYANTLPDQFIDITGLPNGTYRIVSVADPTSAERPGGRMIELNNANNAAAVDVTITASAVTVVAGSARAPYFG